MARGNVKARNAAPCRLVPSRSNCRPRRFIQWSSPLCLRSPKPAHYYSLFFVLGVLVLHRACGITSHLHCTRGPAESLIGPSAALMFLENRGRDCCKPLMPWKITALGLFRPFSLHLIDKKSLRLLGFVLARLPPLEFAESGMERKPARIHIFRK